MSAFICPVCKKQLNKADKTMRCENGHNFDISKNGYVNLLMSNKRKEKRHGDDHLMVTARREFLNKGYYNIILQSACETIIKYAKPHSKILDVGCGECYYTANIYNYLIKNNIASQMAGIDISKQALNAGAKRNKNIDLAVASVSDIPADNESYDIIINFFAPFGTDFFRVLKKEGVIIRIIPLERHLWSLKAKIYDLPYENKYVREAFEGFSLAESIQTRTIVNIDNKEDIENAFKMTPYYYKTGINDQQKLKSIDSLNLEVEFEISVYKKL